MIFTGLYTLKPFKFSQGCRGIGRQFDTDGFFVFEKKCAHRQVEWLVFSPNNIRPVVMEPREPEATLIYSNVAFNSRAN